jgi:hypothetical protein
MCVALDDEGGSRRLRFRLRLLGMTLMTILITTWFITLGAVPAILALVVAKHVLVALLVMGLGVDAKHPAEV